MSKSKENPESRNRVPPQEREGIKYHYNREERLRRFRRNLDTRSIRGFIRRRKRRRGLIIIFIDLFLIALAFYLLNKPANVYLQKEEENILYELNITGIRGGKVLVGFTIKNESDRVITLFSSFPVTIKIVKDSSIIVTSRKSMDHDTVLSPGESSSTIFLLDEDDLPRTATLELYYNSDSSPLFMKSVRF